MLERFMPSVLRYRGDADVVVADNGSTDDSVDFLQRQYPEVQLITMDRNYGFADGYNRAIAQLTVDYDYYILLNSDVECTPHWIEPVIEMMERIDNYAIAQPKLLMHACKDTFEYAGGAGGFIDRYGYPFCRGRLFSSMEKDHGQYNEECEIFWATGAAMFVKAKVWHELGGLDGDFFAHMEEIDFCWRAKQAGYSVRYCPNSTVYHVGGGTLPKSNPWKTELNFRNNLSMLYKNLPERDLRRVLSLRMLLDRVAALKFLLEGHVGEYHAVRKAHKEYREWQPSLKEKRRHINPKPVSCIYQGLLLPEYYLLRHKTFPDLRGRYSK